MNCIFEEDNVIISSLLLNIGITFKMPFVFKEYKLGEFLLFGEFLKIFLLSI